jgi:large subunit ribosomal protein L28
MPKTCFYCGKGPSYGKSISRRGMAKRKGGVGQKITGISVRKFKPNLHSVKSVVDGTTKTVNVCTKCIHLGKVKKPVKVKKAAVAA